MLLEFRQRSGQSHICDHSQGPVDAPLHYIPSYDANATRASDATSLFYLALIDLL